MVKKVFCGTCEVDEGERMSQRSILYIPAVQWKAYYEEMLDG